jgi:uncharacterized protein
MASTVREGKKTEGEKFADYFDFSEPLNKLPSHRILALFRGEKEEILDLQLQPEGAAAGRRCKVPANPASMKIAQRFRHHRPGRPGDRWLVETVRWAGAPRSRCISASTCGCGCGQAAETEAVRVFAATCATCCWPRRPARAPTMGLDPGFRTGVKVASSTPPARWSPPTAVYPHEPRSAGTRRWRSWASWP